MKPRTMILLAIAAVAAYLIYSWWRTRRVLDPSNSKTMSDIFDKMNPTIPGVSPTTPNVSPIANLPFGGFIPPFVFNQAISTQGLA